MSARDFTQGQQIPEKKQSLGGGAQTCVGAGLDGWSSHWDIKQAQGSESQ